MPSSAKRGRSSGREQLAVLDPVAEAERRPDLLRRLERVERLAVRPVADRVDADREAGGCAAADDLGELRRRS